MSKEQLALLCNIDRSYLGRIERGEVNPTLEKVYELAIVLQVTVKDFFQTRYDKQNFRNDIRGFHEV